jgi:hypothetical protein
MNTDYPVTRGILARASWGSDPPVDDSEMPILPPVDQARHDESNAETAVALICETLTEGNVRLDRPNAYLTMRGYMLFPIGANWRYAKLQGSER